ncbi:MAG: class II aldolase/adducin family protein [Betaproteobacteria bacterium AqS2]|uniref:Class II aldolase/adducin family protein n=1 Tax=Candidatus Amphirhobacter heronislandensis TaxID=1732024 RepID=A0A930UEY7_9GAMM|nr:class II aldolase/adducin family protein [Betaproteobacteria bacterium AqS2]
MDETELRQQVIDACLGMNRLGINQGTSGNVSAAVADGILISPSATPYESLRPADIVHVRADGSWDPAQLPSVEWHFHLGISQARPDIKAIVHTHSMYASICSIRREAIPAVHYMIAAAGGPDIRCSDYHTYGTPELAETAIKALEGRMACLLANHGVIAAGTSVAKALWLAKEVEVLAQQYVFSQLLGGAGPVLLDDAEIERVREKMKGYGIKD